MKLFPKNLDHKGRWIRGVLGILLLGSAYWTMSWILLGVALFVLFESFMSWCLFYQMLGINSCPIKPKK